MLASRNGGVYGADYEHQTVCVEGRDSPRKEAFKEAQTGNRSTSSEGQMGTEKETKRQMMFFRAVILVLLISIAGCHPSCVDVFEPHQTEQGLGE